MPNNYKECKAKIVSLGDIPLGVSNIFQYTRHYIPTLPLDVLFWVGYGSECTLFIHYPASIIRKHFSLEIILFVTSKADKYWSI